MVSHEPRCETHTGRPQLLLGCWGRFLLGRAAARLTAALPASTPFHRFLNSFRTAKHLGAFGQRKVTGLKGRKQDPGYIVSRLVL